MDAVNVTLAAVGLLFTACSFGILVANEVRRVRTKPRVRLTAEFIGKATFKDEQWEVIEIGNTGDATAIVALTEYFEVTPLTTADMSAPVTLKVPKTLPPATHVRIMVQGDLDRAWVRFMWHEVIAKKFTIEWLPLLKSSTVDVIHHDQWEQAIADHRARRRPRFWTRRYWTVDRRWRPSPIGPVDDGRPWMVLSERRQRRHPDIVEVAISGSDGWTKAEVPTNE